MRRLAKASSVGQIDGTGSSRGRFSRAFAALAGTSAIALVLALAGAPAASAAPWGFEQVSPVNKGAGAVSAIDTFTASRDGGTMLYSAIGSFDEYPSVSVPAYNRYFAQRGATRWENRSIELAYDLPPDGVALALSVMQTLRASVNLKYSLAMSSRAYLPGAIQGGSNLYMRENATGDLRLIAATPNYDWMYNSITHLGQTQYLWVAPDGNSALFWLRVEIDGVPPGYVKWTEAGGLETAAFDESGNPSELLYPPGAYDNGPHEPLPAEDALDHLYMSSSLNEPAYLMEDGKAVPISVSERAEDLGTVKKAEVVSVSEGGRYAFIRSVGPLTEGTSAELGALVLYRYDRINDDLEYIGEGGSSTSLDVIQASEDGQTIAFTTSESLRPGDPTPDPEGSNVYVWRNGSLQLAYTAEAGSKMGTGASMKPLTLHILSRNGRYLYFTDNSKSVAEEFGDDPTSLACAKQAEPSTPLPCDQVYLFDADAASDQLDCLSCVEGPSPGNSGDILALNSGYVRFNNHGNQYVSNDGRAFFATVNSYDPADANGLPDVYEFHQGDYRLVSTGAAGQSARFIDASDDGKTIFFTTADAIVPQDTDKAVDLYVTREGAGFPYKPNETTPPCMALESCHGGIPGVTPGPGASTSTFEGRANAAIVNGTVKVTKAVARGTTATVTVKVSGPGKVTARGTGLVKATKRAKKAGSVKLSVRLTAKEKAALKKHGKLKRTVSVAFEPDEGRGASASRAIAFKASAGKGGR